MEDAPVVEMLLKENDKELLEFYLAAPENSATATEVRDALAYSDVGAVNLHVARLAKRLASIFGYQPTVRENGQKRWWPCLFNGRSERHGFVWTLKPEVAEWFRAIRGYETFEEKVRRALRDVEGRQQRLAVAQAMPEKRNVQVVEFIRNADVVAEVLARAAGHCQQCGTPAPFLRRSDGTPYLEVHHVVPLADGGEDTVKNAIALCPNCHRERHYG
jgi:predicted HNH restriction endonuclease